MIGILQALIGLASFACFLLVLVKLFQQKGPLHGILGIICGLYTFIWGWMNADSLGIKNLMLAWTALIILGIVLGWMGGYSYGRA
ncbi:MAG TPA: hypothetical protein VNH22_06925 [Blastocatellia bacterium]|jgi:hypothetical protein|nr:hypothetical protein [Blastocatellia bacterium]